LLGRLHTDVSCAARRKNQQKPDNTVSVVEELTNGVQEGGDLARNPYLGGCGGEDFWRGDVCGWGGVVIERGIFFLLDGPRGETGGRSLVGWGGV